MIKQLIQFIVTHLGCKNRIRLLRMSRYVCRIVRDTPGSYTYDIHQRLTVDNFLPDSTVSDRGYECSMKDLTEDAGKVRIRIQYPSGTNWNGIGSFYDSVIKDDKYQVCILVENYPMYLNVMRKQKCSYILLDNYSLEEDRPDILVLTAYSSLTEVLSFPGSKGCAGHVISLFPNVIINETDIEYHWRRVKDTYKNIQPEYYLFDSLVYQNSKPFIPQNKAIHMGHPQFDDLYKKINSNQRNDIIFDKLEGKKVFLLATDHGINEDYPIVAASIDLYFKDFLKFFNDHPEYGLIIRFHPYEIREMLEQGIFWNYYDLERIKEYCRNSNNIVWDDTDDFCNSFIKSDAMFVDVNCSFTISYLPMDKPICRLQRSDVEPALIHPELKEGYYFARCFADCERFIDIVNSNVDEKRNQRRDCFKNSMLWFDGKNGSRIKKFIDDLVGTDKENISERNF